MKKVSRKEYSYWNIMDDVDNDYVDVWEQHTWEIIWTNSWFWYWNTVTVIDDADWKIKTISIDKCKVIE